MPVMRQESRQNGAAVVDTWKRRRWYQFCCDVTPSCRRTERSRRRWRKHVCSVLWSTRETCFPIDSSVLKNTPKSRTTDTNAEKHTGQPFKPVMGTC